MSVVQAYCGWDRIQLTTVLCLPSFPWGPQAVSVGVNQVLTMVATGDCPSTVSPPERPTNAMVGFAIKCLLPGFAPHALANAHPLRTLSIALPIPTLRLE